MLTRRRGSLPISVILVLVVVGLLMSGSEDQDEPSRPADRKAERTKPHKPAKDPKPPTKSPAKPTGEIPAEAKRAEVIEVTDGDTVKLTRTGSSRLIGIDTPEVYFEEECFGSEASDFAKSELQPGERVWFIWGAERRDRYDRALIYLWTDDGAFFNAELARLGFAVPLTIEPNSRFAELFSRLAAKAERLSRGLWAQSTCAGDADRPAG